MGLMQKLRFWWYADESRSHGRSLWKFILRTRIETCYQKQCVLLDAADIDYRVWMNEDEPSLVYLREYLGDETGCLRRHYIFFVPCTDYKRACQVLGMESYDEKGIDAVAM